jgi:DNA repair protein RAD50
LCLTLSKHLQREQHQLSSEKELKVNTLRSISDELSRKTVRLSELRTKQEKRRMDEAALKEQQEQVVVLQRELKELDAKAAAAVAPWREKNEAIDRYRVERQTTESEASHQVDLYRQSMGQVQSQHSACQNYIAEGNDRKMRENETHLADVRREITNLQTQRNKIDTELSEIQDQISQAQVTRKNIRNNLDYREEIREITKVETELDDLDLDAAHKARSEFNSVYKKKMEEETSVSSQVSSLSHKLG